MDNLEELKEQIYYEIQGCCHNHLAAKKAAERAGDAGE